MIHTVIQQLLDAILPPPEPVRHCRALTTADIDNLWLPTTRNGVSALLPITNPSVRALVHANKFHHDRHARHLLAYALSRGLEPLLEQRPTTLLPIPLGPARERERGHNQVTSILRTLPNFIDLDYASINTTLLQRTRETPMQSHLNRRDRLKNVAGCFTFKPKDGTFIAAQHLIIVDDVVTTGATLEAAAKALRPHLSADTTLSLLALAY